MFPLWVTIIFRALGVQLDWKQSPSSASFSITLRQVLPYLTLDNVLTYVSHELINIAILHESSCLNGIDVISPIPSINTTASNDSQPFSPQNRLWSSLLATPQQKTFGQVPSRSQTTIRNGNYPMANISEQMCCWLSGAGLMNFGAFGMTSKICLEYSKHCTNHHYVVVLRVLIALQTIWGERFFASISTIVRLFIEDTHDPLDISCHGIIRQ